MTVHINGSKGKELYYNGVKIKEAYYGGTKVYSSGPLYYCYKMNNMYCYVTENPPSGDIYYPFSHVDSSFSKANSVSDLILTDNLYVYNFAGNSFDLAEGVYRIGTFTYYQDGDLYT